jgi:O-acetyl-ADP-ribose deacetylase (regulator of RNase III)
MPGDWQQQKTGSLTFLVGDATNPVGDGPRIIAHGCNDQNRWGAGFVLALSQRYPLAKKRYHQLFEDGKVKVQVGDIQIVEVGANVWVANLITQHGIRWYRNPHPFSYSGFYSCLQQLAAFATQVNASVHMPKIGCGLAGGTWDNVRPIVSEELCDRGIEVFVYELPTALKNKA